MAHSLAAARSLWSFSRQAFACKSKLRWAVAYAIMRALQAVLLSITSQYCSQHLVMAIANLHYRAVLTGMLEFCEISDGA